MNILRVGIPTVRRLYSVDEDFKTPSVRNRRLKSQEQDHWRVIEVIMDCSALRCGCNLCEMSATKQREIETELSLFSKEWEELYSFTFVISIACACLS
jgi:hypothetical protein